jgi:hypothetical protein
MHTSSQGLEEIEPLLVTRKQAQRLLSYGETKIDELIKQGILESFVDRRSRRITMQSIRRLIESGLARAKAA